MHHLLARSRIRLTYLQDRRDLAGVDWLDFATLNDTGKSHTFRWLDLDGFSHAVLAADCVTGRYVGMVGLVEQSPAPERCLLVRALLAQKASKPAPLRRAMLAHVLARVMLFDGKPAALAAPRDDDVIAPALRDFAKHIPQAAQHPPAAGNVIAFEAAALARRTGAVHGPMLDLRHVTDRDLLGVLRSLHGRRPRRGEASPGKPATGTRTSGART